MKTVSAKVFKSGNSQAIRLPKKFRLDTKEVFIYKLNNQLILTPKMTSWEGFSEGFSGFSHDFSTQDNLPEDSKRKVFE